MPPTRSSQRARRVRDVSPSLAHAEMSSPSRPSKRRRRADPDPPPPPPSDPVDEEDSSLTIDPTNDNNVEPNVAADTIITRVTEHLASTETKASKEHANANHTSQGDIEAYAKIAAREWTYYVRQLNVNIGRFSEMAEDGTALAQNPEDEGFVHIDLGPNKIFSRKTARVFYGADEEKWFLECKGRNPVKVNGVPLKKDDEPHPLSSGEVIEAGGIEMMFVLPASTSRLQIHDMFISRIGPAAPQIKHSGSSPSLEARHALPAAPLSSGDRPSSSNAGRPPSSRGGAFPQPIAPAPPDYKRPGTPQSAKSRTIASAHKSPAYGSSGTMLLNNGEVDLSLEENKHIKPSYSYAQMITQAIVSQKEQKLNLNNIYRRPRGGRQNSIRHNLSLNKAFIKAPRSTDEPGKGMKWEIVPEQREEMTRQAFKVGRGGHRGSSAPSSPSAPNQLNYINHGPKDMTSGREPASARKRKASPTGSPLPSSAFNRSQMTPERSSRFQPPGSASFQDGRDTVIYHAGTPSSPATHCTPEYRSAAESAHAYQLTCAILEICRYWQHTGQAFRHQPVQAVSQLASQQQPAPFAGDDGSRSPIGSPTRSSGRAATQETTTVDEEEEEGGFDLTKGFQSIGSYHNHLGRGGGLLARANGGR
ncbi:Fork-head transcriptional regulator 2 [Apiospora hydei]|uniref:Fork-head transcriptional regulator 2 n=1 Tax=Apiospora hydei TaxID=1337664 RepID=A0ABR1X973_9PEZI